MPELPEVETVVRGLSRTVVGDRVESVWIGDKPQPLKSPAQEIAAALEGARLAAVRRAGKHIVFDLERRGRPSGHWTVHLGMTGRLLVTAHGADLEKHTHMLARLASGRELRFVDARRFGRLAVTRATFEAPGTEPLEISAEAFAALFRGRNTPIKSALLNQKLLRGVGNIYADESLFRAGIRPRRRACRLRRAELARLHHALREVLEEAIAAGGSTVSDYVDSAGDEGMFQLELRVYQREGEACVRCDSAIKRVVVAGRSTHYCARCQK